MLLQNKLVLKSIALIALLILFPFVLQSFSMNLLAGIVMMIVATFLIAQSQIRQVQSSIKEAWWLMPLAPALGMSCIAIMLKAYTQESFNFRSSGIISGLIMCCTYWVAVPVIRNNPKQGKHLMRIDLLGTVTLSLVEIAMVPNALACLYLGITLIVYKLVNS